MRGTLSMKLAEFSVENLPNEFVEAIEKAAKVGSRILRGGKLWSRMGYGPHQKRTMGRKVCGSWIGYVR